MSSFQLDKMTWEDIGKLDRNKTIFFLPVSPMEEHGPISHWVRISLGQIVGWNRRVL